MGKGVMLQLHDGVVLISYVRISALIKINWVVLIRTKERSVFKRMEENIYGFWQTEHTSNTFLQGPHR